MLLETIERTKQTVHTPVKVNDTDLRIADQILRKALPLREDFGWGIGKVVAVSRSNKAAFITEAAKFGTTYGKGLDQQQARKFGQAYGKFIQELKHNSIDQSSINRMQIIRGVI